MMGGSSISKSTTKYTGINLQTSVQGMAIPIGWGRFRASCNIIWYNDFNAQSDSESGGKGGGGGDGQYDYTCAVILAICEGSLTGIQGINRVWAGQSLSSLDDLSLTLFAGSQGQGVWSWLEDNYPSQALPYSGTAYVCSNYYTLGTSPDLPSHNFEVIGNLEGSMPYGNTYDINPADATLDFLSSVYYGANFPAGNVDSTSWTLWKDYCQANTIFFSPYLHEQEQAYNTLTRWAQVTNTWIFWSGNLLKFVPLGTQTLTNNDVTYTPNLSPVYNLTYDDFIYDSPTGQGPIEVTRLDPVDGYNCVQLDICDRANAYNNTSITWMDQVSVDTYGQLQSQVISAPEICDTSIGTYCAALIGKRSVYIRNTYKFTLGYNYVLLEPGDIVTLTDVNIGLSQFPVRITAVDEDEKGMLAITAEEFPNGIGQVTAYTGTTATVTAPINTNALPGNVNTPAIFEPNASLTGGTPQVWIGCSGGQYWGGCYVYISFDGGTTYSNIGQINSATIQGVLTATLASPSSQPDTANTLAVDLTESNSVMPTTATHADATALRTLCLVDTELLAYGAVAQGASEYLFNLTYLERGAYGTTAASHSIGGFFSRINPNSAFTYSLPQAYVGSTLYFKFVSFNQFKLQIQDIADVDAYAYTTTGAGYAIAPPTGATLSVSRTTQADGTTLMSMNVSWTASTGPILGSYQLQISTNGGSAWGPSIALAGNATSYAITPATPGTNYQVRVRAVSTTGINISSWDTSSTANSGALLTAVPSAPASPTVTAGASSANVSITPTAGDYTISSYDIYRAVGASQPFSAATLIQANSLSSSFVDTTAAPNTAYTYFVVAVNAAGQSSPSAGINVTTLPVGAGNPYDVPMSYTGFPPAAVSGTNYVFYRAIMARAVVFPANFAGSLMAAKVAPTSNYVATIYKNGTSVGTCTLTSATTNPGTFTSAGGTTISFSAGDILEIDAQSSQDATLQDLSITLTGTR
jgi:hypothetical protein